MKRHGQLEPLAEVDLSPVRVIDITIRFGEQRWKIKNLSVYTTAKKLRGLLLLLTLIFIKLKYYRVCFLKKFFTDFISERLGSKVGVPSSKVQLFQTTAGPYILLQSPSKALFRYNIQDGDELTMKVNP